MVTLKPWKWFRRRSRENPPDPMIQFFKDMKFRNEPKVPTILIETGKGYSRMKKVEALGGEFLIDPYDKHRKKSEKDIIYTGLPAHILEFDASIFPSRFARLFYNWVFPLGLRLRVFHRLYDEPCTRDLYTGGLLRPEKKRTVLIEKGVIDEEGFFLEPPEVDETGRIVKKGARMILEGCWIKPDFSDVDFIKSEYHAFKQSESVVETAKAMKKTGMAFDKWFYITLMVALAAIVVVVFVMSGGINLG